MGFIEDLWGSYTKTWNSFWSQTATNVSSNVVGGSLMGILTALGIGYVVYKSGLVNKIIRAIK
jgi:hypothetical protein